MIHPAKLMLLVWGGAIVLFFALPFELTNRNFSLAGFGILFLFISSFCFGAVVKTLRLPKRNKDLGVTFDFRRFDYFLRVVSIITIVVFLIEILQSNSLNLLSAYANRSAQAQALLHGELSNSSVWFKIGFLLYPASYIYLIKELIFTRNIKLISFALYGLFPGILSALAMGGRATMFNIIAYSIIAYRLRNKRLETTKNSNFVKPGRFKLFLALILIFSAFVYFVNVFNQRAEGVGGAIGMLDIAGTVWGVRFSGPMFDIAVNIFGAGFVFIIFTFSWYLLQGIVMSNYLLINYDGSALLGIYGLDLASAIFRRVNPEWVSANFNYLLSMETYGFLPSAFGTLFIDFKYFGFLAAAVWGWLAGLVYLRVRTSLDERWLLCVPVVVFGILFSLINTPLGYSNGLMTHLWLVVGFLLVKKTYHWKI